MQTTWRVTGAHYSVSITKTHEDSNGETLRHQRNVVYSM